MEGRDRVSVGTIYYNVIQVFSCKKKKQLCLWLKHIPFEYYLKIPCN